MKRELGIARCGLACCLCSENVECKGCRQDGFLDLSWCKDAEWCENRKCVLEKKLNGCYECEPEHCRKGLYTDKIKARAFAEFARRYGITELLDCLERNEQKGIVYHREGIMGDYDDFDDLEELIAFIRTGERDCSEDREVYVKAFTEEDLPAVLDFEKRLREEEDVWGWEIDDRYVEAVKASFHDCRFDNAISLLAYEGGRVAGRIDAVLIPTRMDGSINAYLDWICVIKSCRHRGIAQKLLNELKKILKEQGVGTLIALTAANEEAQRFYRSIPDSEMKDTGIWINIE